MSPFDLFSKRQKIARGEMPDVFVYDRISKELRVQIVHIWRDVIGRSDVRGTPAHGVYKNIVDILCREYGVFALADGAVPGEVLANFFLAETNVDRVLDVIEISFRMIQYVRARDGFYGAMAGARLEVDAAIQELNARFLEHDVGYEYVSGEIIKKDSEFLHSEAIKPALSLLQDSRYKGANDEFLKAHEEYRRGDTKDCLVNCLKALESTLKTICEIRGWPFQKTDTAKTLLEKAFQNGLVPAFWQSHYTALRTTLESGVPTGRNKLGGHGQGSDVVEVPPHVAAYMLHMTGSAIQFLISAEKGLP